MSTNAEEFSYETLRVAAQAAAAHEKTKLITVYPSQPYRHCGRNMRRRHGQGDSCGDESVAYVFLQHSQLDKAN